jgi:hypothetical protein
MGKCYLAFVSIIFILAVQTVSADIVQTKDGARLVGKVLQIDGTTVVLDTVYAGSVRIKQSEVTSITTDNPANVRLSTGTVVRGQFATEESGALVIKSQDGSIPASVDKVVATWALGADDPAVIALRRTWAYEAGVDVLGKTGNSEQLGTGFRVRATLTGPQDKLQFYSAYDRQIAQGVLSADQLKAGADYQNSFAGRYSWYSRDELGFDRVKLIAFSNVAALGLGYDIVKGPKETLTGRFGFSHRFESYRVDPVLYQSYINPIPPGVPLPSDQAQRLATKNSVNSAGLDFELNHSIDFAFFSIVNRLDYVPTFADHDDYHVTQESFLELPLKNPMWKLRAGVTNDYSSKPAQGKARLDTTYSTRLMLTWK